MDVLRIFQDYSVQHATEGHKHTRPGWVNTECPFCTGNAGLHLGWNIREEYFFCWRCGWHPPVKTLSKLMNVNTFTVQQIVTNYGVNRSQVFVKDKVKKPFKLPSEISSILPHHRKYLEGRGFNVDELIKTWDIKSAGPMSMLDGVNYSHRIIIPYKWNGEVVSFDGRDVTGKQVDKYKACPKDREAIERKRILYGNQEAWESTGICVEGPTDVWRLGEKAFAVSGISYKFVQASLIGNIFKRVAIVFDSEYQAQVRAEELKATLEETMDIEAWIVNVKDDPGSLTDREAKDLVKTILKRK
jgi:hypothetical protein